MKAIELPQNPFGFPVRAQHVSAGAFPALIKAAGTVDQLNLALETISRIEQTPVKVAPRQESPAEITPMCKKLFLDTADRGSDVEILKLASISRRFRVMFPRAVALAERRQPQLQAIS